MLGARRASLCPDLYKALLDTFMALKQAEEAAHAAWRCRSVLVFPSLHLDLSLICALPASGTEMGQYGTHLRLAAAHAWSAPI